VIARNLGREGEWVERTTLGALDSGGIDMQTLVLIGSTSTKALGNGLPYVYTPRGYARKEPGGPSR